MVDKSIIILCKNQFNYLKKSIPVLLNQNNVGKYEIVVVDSGSTDGTDNFLKNQKVILLKIKPEDFHFSKTFNWAAKQVDCEIIIRLSGDVIPIDNLFLYNLTKQFQDPEVAATYSRYILQPNSDKVLPLNWPEKRFKPTSEIYQIDPKIFSKKSMMIKNNFVKLTNLAGGACAIRKSVFDQRPFNTNLLEAEDAEYSFYLHHSGYKIGYSAEAKVIHEHEKIKLTPKTIKKLLLVYTIFLKEIANLHIKQVLKNKTMI